MQVTTAEDAADFDKAMAEIAAVCGMTSTDVADALQQAVNAFADDLDASTAKLIAEAALAEPDPLDVATVIRLAAGPLIFLAGALIGWRLGRGR